MKINNETIYHIISTFCSVYEGTIVVAPTVLCHK